MCKAPHPPTEPFSRPLSLLSPSHRFLFSWPGPIFLACLLEHNFVGRLRGFRALFSQDYIPVDQEELRDYVKARLKVFYEEELDVPLVLFNEVLDHVLRIDR